MDTLNACFKHTMQCNIDLTYKMILIFFGFEMCTLTSCKMLRNCSNCCLQYCTSWIIEFRSVLSSIKSCSSGEPLAESRPNCDCVLQLIKCKFSIERGLSEPFRVGCKRDRFKSRVDRAGSWELLRNKQNNEKETDGRELIYGSRMQFRKWKFCANWAAACWFNAYYGFTHLFDFKSDFRTINVSDGLRSVFMRLAPIGEIRFIMKFRQISRNFTLSSDEHEEIMHKFSLMKNKKINDYENKNCYRNRIRATSLRHTIVPRLQQSSFTKWCVIRKHRTRPAVICILFNVWVVEHTQFIV